jgi:ribosomal protein S1
VAEKYKIGQIVEGSILKVNPFGLFVSLDEDIHGLAHISQLGLAPKQKISEVFQAGEVKNFEIVSIEAKEHRLGLMYNEEIANSKAGTVRKKKAVKKTGEKKTENSEQKTGEKKTEGKKEEDKAKE